MKISLSTAATLLLSSAVTSAPVLSVRQTEGSAYTITLPVSGTTLTAGQNTAITWIPGDNSATVLNLVTVSNNSNTINLARDVNGYSGTRVVQLPENVSNCSQWKVALQHSGNETSYSEPFYVSKDGSPCSDKSQAFGSPTASMANQLSGATATASIDILGDDGQPIETGRSGAAHVVMSYGIIVVATALAAAAVLL